MQHFAPPACRVIVNIVFYRFETKNIPSLHKKHLIKEGISVYVNRTIKLFWGGWAKQRPAG